MCARFMTIPEFARLEPIDLLGREQSSLPQPGAVQNLHILVWGQLELPPGGYQLLVTADDHYQLWLQGAYQGQGPVPSYPHRSCYDIYPVSGGKTTVALHLYYQGLRNRVWNSGDNRLGLWLSVRRGREEIACCDGTWKYTLCHAYSGQPTGYDTQFLENFDSRLWPSGWEQPDFDHSGWGHLAPAAWHGPLLEPRPIRPLAEYPLPPHSRTAISGGVLLDFGREITGTVMAEASGPPGSRVVLRFGEELEEGRVRWKLRCNCDYQETWTLGQGISRLHPYDYKAFRYAELLCPPEVTIHSAVGWVRHYPMGEACTLRCKEGELEDIFRICKNAVRCCTQEGYLDCPSREKGQYLGDAVITARSQIWLTGSTEVLRKCVRDFLDSQAISPTPMAVAPGSLMQEIGDFSLLFPLLLLTDYAFTGDLDFLARGYPSVVTMTEGFRRYQREDGLLGQVGDLWNLVDWPENLRDGYDFPLTRPVVGPGCHNVINALWYGANRMREEIEELLGLPVKKRSSEIGKAFRTAFYREEQRLFADSEASSHCSLHSNVYPAYFGLLPKEAERSYEALLLTPGRCCGAIPTYFALKSLGKLGRQETLLKLLTREDAWGWRNMLREGATAAFEAWGRDQKWNTSLCHGWNSGPIPLFIEELAGLQPDPAAPEGLSFRPPVLPGRPDFTLRVPWQGKIWEVSQRNGGCPQLRKE